MPGRITDLESEQVLLERARAGDRSALACMLRRHRATIERICTRLCAASDTPAEDVVQDTYLGIMRNIAAFRGEASFSTWAYTIARTAHGRRRRRERMSRRLETLAVVSSPGALPAANDRPPDEIVAATELGRVLARVLATLSELDRRVLLMRDFEGWSASEVAQHTGLTVAAVKTRLHRARVAVRARLAASAAAA